MDLRISMLLDLLDESYDRKSWHGPNLRGSIRRVTAGQAVWRPAAGRKCIAEIAVHAAYWKYTVRRRILDEKRGSFPLKGSNWFALPRPFGETDWKAAAKLLEEQHRALRAVVAAMTPAELDRVSPGGKYANAFIIRGIAMHDVYHAGQIQTLKAMQM